MSENPRREGQAVALPAAQQRSQDAHENNEWPADLEQARTEAHKRSEEAMKKLEAAREAYAHYERGEQFGKIVLQVRDE